MGEHLPCKQGVDSSSLFISTNCTGSEEAEGAEAEGLREPKRRGPSAKGHREGLIAQVVRAHA